MPGNTNFRKVLLNKCQNEFEMETSVDEEKHKVSKTVSYVISNVQPSVFTFIVNTGLILL